VPEVDDRRRGDQAVWFAPDVKTVSSELLLEVWLCAHLVVLHRRRDGGGRVDDAGVRRETCSRMKGCLQEFSREEWGQETVMSCYQRAIDDAFSLDLTTLGRDCGFAVGRTAEMGPNP
jgi:hypothetical protein